MRRSRVRIPAAVKYNFLHTYTYHNCHKTRIKEHKRAVEYNGKIAQHVEQYDHNMDFENAEIVSREKNYRKRLFLEAWYSQVDKSSGNDYIDIPDVYGSLMHPN